MALWGPLNRTVFKKTSTFFLVATLCTFFYERAFENICTAIFERINKGKMWKEVAHRFEKKPEPEAVSEGKTKVC